MTSLIPDALALIIGYLLGSIPFGLLLTRGAGAPDVRGPKRQDMYGEGVRAPCTLAPRLPNETETQTARKGAA